MSESYSLRSSKYRHPLHMSNDYCGGSLNHQPSMAEPGMFRLTCAKYPDQLKCPTVVDVMAWFLWSKRVARCNNICLVEKARVELKEWYSLIANRHIAVTSNLKAHAKWPTIKEERILNCSHLSWLVYVTVFGAKFKWKLFAWRRTSYYVCTNARTCAVLVWQHWRSCD